MKPFFALLLLIIGSQVQARVFDMSKDNFAPYFLATGGGSFIGTAAVDGEGAVGNTFTGGVKYNYTSEFGFVRSRSSSNLKFGVEILKPTSLEATASDGTSDLYAVKGELVGYAPKVGVEFNITKAQSSRLFFALAVGSATLTLKNDYVLTAAGQTAYPGVADHSVEASAATTLSTAALGFEGLLSDTTTYLLEVGYRQLKFDNFKFTKNVTTFSGAKVSGDSLLTNTGLNRTLDFSGSFLTLGFRFYF